MFTEQELLEIEERLRHTKVRQAFLECIDAIVLYDLAVYDIEKSTHIYEAEEEWEALAGVSYFLQIVDRVTLRQLKKFRESYYKTPDVNEREELFRTFHKKSIKQRKITQIRDYDRISNIDKE